MKQSKQLVPELRFPEFDKANSEIVYKTHKFKNLFEFKTGKNIKQKEASSEFKIPCVRYGELYHLYNEVINEVINKTNLEESELLFSEGNEILLPSAGEDPLDIGSASALTIKNVAIGRTINILKPKKNNNYSQIYVSYCINEKLKRKIARLAKGVSISNVYNSDLKTLSINLPSLPEQQKIADFLSQLDKKIDLLSQKRDHLEQYKKGVMQKLFSQEVRFKRGLSEVEGQEDGRDFPDWEEKQISQIGKVITGKTPITRKKELWDGNIQFITPTDIDDLNKYQLTTKRHVKNDKKIKILPIGSILYTCIASIGKMTITTKDSISNQQINAIVVSNKHSNEYIWYYLLHITPRIKATQANTTLPIINKKDFSKIKIKTPVKEEQAKIADYLSAIDQKISFTQQQLEQTQTFKKGLLQKMFV